MKETLRAFCLNAAAAHSGSFREQVFAAAIFEEICERGFSNPVLNLEPLIEELEAIRVAPRRKR